MMMRCLTLEWQELMAVRNWLDSMISNFFISMSGLYGDACYDVMYSKFAQVRLQTVGCCHLKGSGGTNHLMATKLAITTNKHKTQSHTVVFFSKVLGALGLTWRFAVGSKMKNKSGDILQMIVD